MFKKLGVLIFALSGITMACAEDVLPYVGGEIGYDTDKWQIKDMANIKRTADANGVFGGLFAGLTWTLAPRFAVNTELFGDESSTATNTHQIILGQAKVRLKYSYGFSLMPGLIANNGGMFYLRFGIIRSQFNLNQSIPPVYSHNTGKNVAGAEAGIGVQGNLNNDWGLRAEYDYVSYNSFTLQNITISPRINNQFKIGVFFNLH